MDDWWMNYLTVLFGGGLAIFMFNVSIARSVDD